MQSTRKWVAVLAAVWLLGLAGCAAHSPWIVRNTTDADLHPQNAEQSHANKVLFLDNALPSNVEYKLISQIDAGRIWYGGADGVLTQMADKARELGADAVVEIATWHQPSGFAWAAPHGSGKAVKILNKDKVDLNKLGGQWR
jgi:hypothetical protein